MPQKTLDLLFARTAGVATAIAADNLGGLAFTGFSVNATNAGGFYTAPVQLPDDADPSRPITIYHLWSSLVAIVTTGRVLSFKPRISYLNPGGVQTRLDIDHAYLTPDNWGANEWVNLPLDSDLAPAGYTIAGGTLAPGAWLGLRVYRDSLDAADTYPNAIFLTASAQMRYYQRCQKCCC